MSTDVESDHPADETEGFLSNEASDHFPQRSFRHNKYPIWMRCLLYSSQTARTPLRASKIYALFVFVPLGIAAHASGWPSITILIFNLLAIIPLSALVSYAADKLSNTWGELVGGLINATFGNAVELVVCPPSLHDCCHIGLIIIHRLAFWPYLAEMYPLLSLLCWVAFYRIFSWFVLSHLLY